MGGLQPEVAIAQRNSMRTSAASPIWLLVDSSRNGGIETHLLELAHALSVRTVHASVVFYADHGPHPMRAALDDARLSHFTLGGSIASLVRGLGTHRPALVHTHGYKAGILARATAPLLGIPVVSTFHSGEPGEGRVRAYNALDRLTARFATCIAVSEGVRRALPESTCVIENFIRLPESVPDAPSSGQTIAFVGRLEPEKGPDEFCAIAASVPHARFEMYGDGSMREELQLRYGDRVRFHGMVASMSAYWPRIGLLCMPSRYEGLPMALLEAMAHGVLVAAYAVGGLATSVLPGQTGWLVPPGDRAALTAAIAGWCEQDGAERTRMRQAARDTVQARFSSAAAVDKVLAVYADALAR